MRAADHPLTLAVGSTAAYRAAPGQRIIICLPACQQAGDRKPVISCDHREDLYASTTILTSDHPRRRPPIRQHRNGGGRRMSEDLRLNAADQQAEQYTEFHLQLLGSFLLRRADTRIALPTGPQRLLAFLAIQGPVPSLVTMGTLWPHVGEQHARGSLRTAMWRLHRDAPRLVERTDDMLALRGEVRVDIHAATDSAQLILQDRGQVSASRAFLYARGDLLPGWYDDWVIFERERFRQLRLHALDALARQFNAQGRYIDALEAAIESVRIEPLRESANRMIIAIHLTEGNVVEAVRHYRFFRDLLRAELGIEPSPQLTELMSDAKLLALANQQ